MAWDTIAAGESGQFSTEKGMFTFFTIYPLLKETTSSTGASPALAESGQTLEAGQYYWKLVSRL